jgi:hypothetical protein
MCGESQTPLASFRVTGASTLIGVAQGKKVTRRTLIGEKGIALISRRCIDMGYLIHPRRVDHGIGHIDLVDPTPGALLN